MAAPLLLLGLLLLHVGPFFARTLKEELAGNFVDCQYFGAGKLNEQQLQAVPRVSETLFGYFISKTVARPLDGRISVKLLRDLKSDNDQASSAMKLGAQGRRWRSMWPAVIWCNNRWHTITRLIDEDGPGWLKSNYLITQMFDDEFQPASPSRLVGLPTALSGVLWTGLEDPRLLVHKGHLLIEGTMHYPGPKGEIGSHDGSSRVAVLDAGTSTGVMMDVPGQPLYQWEKSWTGFVKDDTLHFLYSFYPLVELECKDDGACVVVYHETRCPTGPCVNVPPRGIEGHTSFLRGGSSMIPWSTPGYFVGFAHTTLIGAQWAKASNGVQVPPLKPGVRWHKIHMFVYNSKDHRMVYVSGPIGLGAAMLRSMEPQWNGTVQDATSAVLTPDGHIVMGINLDDSHPVIAAVEGLVPIVDTAIKMDQSGPDAAAAGSTPGAEEMSDPNVLKCTTHAIGKYLRSFDSMQWGP